MDKDSNTMEWQPIETAPQVIEKSILLSNGIEVWEDWLHERYGGLEWMHDEQWQDYGKATHWMPLPSPPEKA